MISRTVYAAMAACALATACAQANEQPVLRPAHDSDITYRVQRGGAVTTERVRWSAARGLQRIDPPEAGLYMLIDRSEMHISVVDPLRRGVLDIDAAKSKPPGAISPGGYASSDMRYEKGGARTIAGLACTEWTVSPEGGASGSGSHPPPAVLCMTADGLLLQVRMGEQVMAEALSVSVAPLNSTLFDIPAAYPHTTPEALQAKP